ncbi:MAG: TonB-dependent receptor, partial [Bacteroidales bacterium]|nr:TonB-dependent receptor [Bacteroidales bacterium]
LSAVNQQLRSNQIINVVSEERIRELPDENAAQAISRLPGVHLDGSRVVIRGIESKMNKIMINGIEMPGTEEISRATDLGIISANTLSGIEVFKTLTPDMDADAVGGVVNLRLREAQPGLHYSITTQGAYNQQEKISGGYKFWGDIGNRFFDNRLGIVININYEKSDGGYDYIRPGYSQHDAGDIGEAKYKFKEISVYDQLKKTNNIGGSVVIDFNLPNGQLIYSGILSHSVAEETLHREYIEVQDGHHQITMDRSKNKRVLLNNSLRLEQRIGIVKIDAGIANVSNDWDDEFRYFYKSKELNGRSPLMIDKLTDSLRLVMEPWQTYAYLDTSMVQIYRGHDAALEPRNYDEKQWLADLNLQVPLQLSDNIDINFKIGGKYKFMDRFYNKDELSYDYLNVSDVHAEIIPWLESIGHDDWETDLYFHQIRDYDYKTNSGFMNNQPYYMDFILDADIMDEFMVRQIDPSTLITYSEHGKDDYWGDETLLAGYIMAEVNLGKRAVIIPGVRYERVKNNYYAPEIEQGTTTYWFIRDTLNGNAEHTHILPHLHIRYRITDWWDLRFSYNKTLSRPDYNHALPLVFYNTINGKCEAGNPNIRPAVSENFDVNFTFFSPKLGLIGIGGFMKNIRDIFYMQPTLLKNIPDSSILEKFPTASYPSLLQTTQNFYVNSPYTAYVKGLEAEWQSNFSWLPEPFNGIVLNANYTHVWSKTKYMQDRIRYERVPGSFLPKPVEVDTFYINRLLHQANDIANVSIGYDWKGLSARLSFRFQGNVISKIGTRPEENEYTRDIYAYDFVIKQTIPIKFGEFEVFLNAINFTNVPSSRYTIYPNKGETTTYERYSGRQFQLGLRFKH